MRCALAAKGFVNEDLQYNRSVILSTMAECAEKADVILFGEAFLQGFFGATFDPVHDERIAVMQDAPVLCEIRDAARQYAVAVSFGFIEKDGDSFYSSQMTVDSTGAILDVYRRISPGWKEASAGSRYREGCCFHAFPLCGRQTAVALCGDLWYEENVRQMNRLNPDLIFWPVYTDYDPGEWNSSAKREYAAQVAKIGKKVLYVNSLCLDRASGEAARGGAAIFENGRILQEIPAGKEGILISEI